MRCYKSDLQTDLTALTSPEVMFALFHQRFVKPLIMLARKAMLQDLLEDETAQTSPFNTSKEVSVMLALSGQSAVLNLLTNL